MKFRCKLDAPGSHWSSSRARVGRCHRPWPGGPPAPGTAWCQRHL